MGNIYNRKSFCWLFIFYIFSINPVQAQTFSGTPLITTLVQSSTRIRVQKFIFKGNTVFNNQQLQKIVAPYLAREISFDELLAARKDVTQSYVDKGYTTSGAFIPSKQIIQQPQGAVITIQIIEGKLEDIKISGDKHIRNYVRSKLHKVTSGVVNTNQLAKTLQLLQTDPLIEKISAQLSQGSQLGKSFLDVKVEARPPFRVDFFVDNSRSPAIGSFQRGVQLTHANLFGLGDSLSFSYRNTDGSNAFEVGYSVPINSDGGTIHLGYTTANSNVIQRPFNRLDIIGDARAYNLTFRQPLLLQINENSISEFALGITASRQESESSLLDTPYPLSPGADDRGRTKISALRFFQEWSTRGNQELVFVRSQFSLGIGALDATINDSPPDSRFFAWQGQAACLRRFGDTSLLLRADLQLADRPLVPLEQFGLGGATTVRGYRTDAFLTDNGFVFSAEVRIPIVNEETSQLQIIPFFDIGTTWNNDSPDELTNASNSGTLASLGLGIQYQLGERLNARLDWGIPLVPLDTPESNTWQEQGLYFSVRYQPF